MSLIATTGVVGGAKNRLNIVDLVKNEKFFTLYVRALQTIQDRNQDAYDSFFLLAGIHGAPFKEWAKPPGQLQAQENLSQAGYCTHSSVLFPTWHRTYLAVFEQVVQSAAAEIAKKYTVDQDAWIQAAQDLRQPYWDWASQTVPPPEIIEDDTVSIVDYDGTKISVTNPFLRYTFHPIDLSFMPFTNFSTWTTTVRCPNSSKDEDKEALIRRLKLRANEIQHHTYRTLRDNSTWEKFSNHGAGDANHTNSLEAIHDTIHVLVGAGKYGGHMSHVYFAAFDPIFWLHHTNVDRCLSLWAAMNPGVWVSPGINPFVTLALQADANITQDTPLEPFYKTSTDVWTSASLADTTLLGYSYPEFNNVVGGAPEFIRDAISDFVDKNYGIPYLDDPEESEEPDEEPEEPEEAEEPEEPAEAQAPEDPEAPEGPESTGTPDKPSEPVGTAEKPGDTPVPGNPGGAPGASDESSEIPATAVKPGEASEPENASEAQKESGKPDGASAPENASEAQKEPGKPDEASAPENASEAQKESGKPDEASAPENASEAPQESGGPSEAPATSEKPSEAQGAPENPSEASGAPEKSVEAGGESKNPAEAAGTSENPAEALGTLKKPQALANSRKFRNKQKVARRLHSLFHGLNEEQSEELKIFDWSIHVSFKKFELANSFSIVFYFADTDREHDPENYVGSVDAFRGSMPDTCANCAANPDLIQEGFVHLNRILAEQLGSFASGEVLAFLRARKLSYKLAAVEENVTLTSLSVELQARPLSIPPGETRPVPSGEAVYYHDVIIPGNSTAA